MRSPRSSGSSLDAPSARTRVAAALATIVAGGVTAYLGFAVDRPPLALPSPTVTTAAVTTAAVTTTEVTVTVGSPTRTASVEPPPWAIDPRPDTPSTPTEAAPGAALLDLPVYYVEVSGGSPRLVRESMATSVARDDIGTRLQGAINSTMVANLPPSHFPAFVTSATASSKGIVVDIRGPGPNFVPSPAELTSMARTAQAVAELGDVPVTIRLSMGPLAGAREFTFGPYLSATMPPVQASPLWVDAPARGTLVAVGRGVLARGTSDTGPVLWSLSRNGTRVSAGQVALVPGQGRRPFALQLGALAAGTYRLTLSTTGDPASRSIPFTVS